MSEVKDWCRKPRVINTLGNGWCVRIDGTDVFDSINQYGCKTLRTFDIVRGLSSEEEAQAYLAKWLTEQIPDFDAQRLRADMADGALEIANRTLAMFADDLQVAEQRIAELTDLLGELDENWNSHDGRERFALAMRKVEAALNPNPEGHYSDCATNNRGVPELLGPCDCGYEGKQK